MAKVKGMYHGLANCPVLGSGMFLFSLVVIVTDRFFSASFIYVMHGPCPKIFLGYSPQLLPCHCNGRALAVPSSALLPVVCYKMFLVV